MDWYRRSGLAWEIAVTMETSFCRSALEGALGRGTPEIFTSDQGAQFTSADCTGRLQSEGIRSSRDGRGRVFDTMVVERLWRTVKDEEISLQDYDTVPAAVASLGTYVACSNAERLHQALGYRTPASGSHGSESRERERLRAGPQSARAATSLYPHVPGRHQLRLVLREHKPHKGVAAI
jgi:putative transposase